MPDIELGEISVTLRLIAEQLEHAADTSVSKLNAVGESGMNAQQKLNPLSATLDKVGGSASGAAGQFSALGSTVEATGNVKIDKLNTRLLTLSGSMEKQVQTVNKLTAELDGLESTFVELEKSMGRSGDFDAGAQFPAEIAALDKEIAKLDELKAQIKLTSGERNQAAASAEQAAAKQVAAANKATISQTALNQKLADKTAANSAKLGLDSAAMAIRGVSSAAGGTVGNLGYLATEIVFLKRSMDGAATSAAALGAVLSVGIMAAVTLITAGVNMWREAEEKRQKAFDDGVQNIKKYGDELHSLETSFDALNSQKNSVEQLTSARNDLASTFPDLVVGYTDEGAAILASNSVIQARIELLKEEQRLARQSVIDSGGDAFRDYEKQEKTVQKLKDELELKKSVYAEMRAEKEKYFTDNNIAFTEKDLQIAPRENTITDLTKKLTVEEQALLSNSKTLNAYTSAYIKNNLEITDSQTGLIKSYDDLDSKQKTVADSFVLNNQARMKSQEDAGAVLAELATLLQSPAEVSAYFDALTQSQKIAETTSALEQLNTAIRSQISELGTLSGAYQTLSGGQQLSLEQLYELAQKYPEVAAYIAETGDLTLQKGEILKAVYGLEREQFLSSHGLNLQELEDKKASAEATLEMAKVKIAAFQAMGTAERAAAYESYYASQSAIKALDENIALAKSMLSDFSFEPKASTGGTKSTERNEALQDELKLLEHKKKMERLSYEEELVWLEKIGATLVKTEAEKMDMEYRIFALKKSHQAELEKQESTAITDLGSAVTTALKAQYTEQKKLETDRINSSIKAWESWESDTVSAIEGQIKALDALDKAQDKEDKRAEYETKRQALQLQLGYENDDYNRKQIEKQLAALDADEQKRLSQLAREDKKSELEGQISSAKAQADARKEGLQAELDAVNENYSNLTDSLKLQAEAELFITEKSQSDVVALLKSYAPEYGKIGETLGERLAEAFRKKMVSVLEYAESVTNQINSYAGVVAGAANKTANNFNASRAQPSGNSTTQYVNSTANFYNPVDSPIATKRALESVSQGLAGQILGG